MQLFGDNSHLNTWTIEKAKEGDRRAQKAIYDSLSEKMFAVCLRYMGERSAAEDVLQDGFVTLFAKLDTFSGDGSFEGWARKIFVNTALMNLRRNDVLKDTEDVSEARSISSEAPSAVQDLGYKELCAMISSLPPGFRTRSQLLRAKAMLQAKILERKK